MRNSQINSVPDTLDQKLWPQIEKLIDQNKKVENEFDIKNTDRAVGTRISYHLYKKFGNNKLDDKLSIFKF